MVVTSLASYGQGITDTLNGEVTFTTTQSVYVRFPATQNIAAGDTLYNLQSGVLIPALIVRHLSSTSVVADPINGATFEKGAKLYARLPKAEPEVIKPDSIPIPVIPEPVVAGAINEEEAPANKVEDEKPSFKGRISAAAYITFNDHPQSQQQRMRYVVTANARRINNSRLSAEVYMAFRHTVNEWDEVQQDFLRAFKVYNLSLEYDFGQGMKVWAGRKINFNISNIGAIDGLQAEKKWKKFLVGGFGGSRPDLMDYGFNPDLVQYGGYAGHILETRNGLVQSTLAMVEQRNSGMTDRRFMYFQHINSAIKRVHIFTSFEFDLYTLENGLPKNTFNITSLYISARYRISDRLSVFGSFDSRNNIIYYESYKNFIDQLLEDETRQGFRFNMNYRPVKKLSIGVNAGYRYQRDTPGDSKNLNAYVTYTRIPLIEASGTATVTIIHSPYLDGIVYGARISKDLIKGKLYGELQYRIAEYGYRNLEFPIKQSILGLNLSWRMTKMLSFSANYETEIQNTKWNNRIYTSLIQRF
jgi:hypothetical protein